MPVNKPSGNGYPWAYTINYIGGRCEHKCHYCYVQDFKIPVLMEKYSRAPFLVEKELKTKLIIPKGYVLFVCSCNDMFGEWVPREWILKILAHCREYEKETTFLFQSKNPRRFRKFILAFPINTILGTTIESNRDYSISKAPPPLRRARSVRNFQRERTLTWMVSIEPVMDFDVEELINLVMGINPKFVSIGADSGNNNLPEPNKKKVADLIRGLQVITDVRVKDNLRRLLDVAS